MFLLEQKDIIDQKTAEVDQIINRQSQLPAQVLREQFTKFRIVDFDEIYSEEFFKSISQFTSKSGSSKWNFSVLVNDPQDFFFHYCKRYPVFEVNTQDLFDKYLTITRGSLDCLSGESIAENAYVIVIYPESLNWVIYGDFHFEIGIVGFQNDLALKSLISIHGKDRIFTIEEAIPNLLEVKYKDNVVPHNIRTALIENYA